jgi:hypothetical protein
MSKRSDLEPEPLLIPDDDRFVVLPVKYQDLYQMYKSAVACFWTADRGVGLSTAQGGSDGNIILDVNDIGDLQLEGTTLETATAGAPVSKFLRIKLNGTYHKIQLYDDV